MKKIRYILWGTVAIMLAVYIGLFVWRGTGNPVFEASSQSESNAFSPSFMLVDHQGNTVTEKTYRGQWLLVFFGFTNCPDICPTALTDMGNALGILGEAADKVTPVFITVDPDRDTPEHLKEYLKFFHPRMVGLTGTPEQTAAALKAYKVYAAKALVEGGDADDYLMDHTSIIYLMGPDGAFMGHFSHGDSPDDIAKGIRKFL